jgi:hypothetical protein
MTTLSRSAGTVAYDSRGSGDPVVLLRSGGHDQHDYDEIRGPLPGGFRSIGAELTSLANTASGGGSQVNDAQDNPRATREQRQ